MARCEALGQIVFPCCVLYSHGNQKDVRSVTSANQHIRPLTQLRLLVQFVHLLERAMVWRNMMSSANVVIDSEDSYN